MSEAEPLFGFSPTHLLTAAVGAAVFVAYLLPRISFLRAASSSAVLMILGLATFTFIPGMPAALDPTVSPRIWEMISEFVVIVVLFATGLRIDNISNWSRWRPTVRLLLIAMPLTIAAVALLGWALAGMKVAGAVLLGAVLSPTDPVLAGDVQVGPPGEGGEHPVRFTLTAEAGLNDGLAFPFVYLGLIIAAQGADPSAWLVEWIARDVIYRIVVGALVGALVGWLLGKSLFSSWGSRAIETGGPGVLALGAVRFAMALSNWPKDTGLSGPSQRVSCVGAYRKSITSTNASMPSAKRWNTPRRWRSKIDASIRLAFKACEWWRKITDPRAWSDLAGAAARPSLAYLSTPCSDPAQNKRPCP